MHSNKCGFYTNNIQDDEIKIIFSQSLRNSRIELLSKFYFRIKKVKGRNMTLTWHTKRLRLQIFLHKRA